MFENIDLGKRYTRLALKDGDAVTVRIDSAKQANELVTGTVVLSVEGDELIIIVN